MSFNKDDNQMEALFIGHAGLGDSLNMIAALKFMSYYYKNVYFVVKEKNLLQIEPFFKDTNIICLSYEYKDMWSEVIDILTFVREFDKKNADIFMLGDFSKYYTGRILNKLYINGVNNFKRSIYEGIEEIKFDHDMILLNDYNFLYRFYNMIGMHFNIYFEYFDFGYSQNSEIYYNKIKDYKRIIFTQTKTSENIFLSINNLINKYINDTESIIVCNDENIYIKYDHLIENKEEGNIKRELVKPYILGCMVDYKDLIYNCHEIYIIDSSFTSLILPLLKTGKLKAEIVRIINRKRINEVEL
jgi:hypothetical protein